MSQNKQYELDSYLQKPLNESFEECIKGLSSVNAEEKLTLLNKLNNLVDTNLKEVLTDNKLRAQLKDLEKVDAKDYPSIAFCQKLSALEKSTDIVKHQCFIEILYQYPAKELALLLLNFMIEMEAQVVQKDFDKSKKELDMDNFAQEVCKILIEANSSTPEIHKKKSLILFRDCFSIYLSDKFPEKDVKKTKADFSIKVGECFRNKLRDADVATFPTIKKLMEMYQNIVSTRYPQINKNVEWDSLCKKFQKKITEIATKYPKLINLETIRNTFDKGEDTSLADHQSKVMKWFSSPDAYPVLKCKNTWPIIKQIRNFILDYWGIRRDKSFDLSKRSMFASDTHQLALDIAAVIPPTLKLK